ncbi:inhibitor of Bruton tyrosine kinase [Thrips palmi]|uniref:Inhibitor of Bruton tyrosine kinase n=1 Tax=Thrips palmi TaxID=161013 RepID=A0A6P8YNX9_THRPL|nr:inhibitor of Bruton tyrosine kinase [Thrips palmi]XP_034241663.1 inhibitor of Bruton tyrosine kinase [Thrips palmi]
MSAKDSLKDCTEKCVSLQHGDSLGAIVTLREPSDKDVATSLSLLCGNVGSLVDSSGRCLLHLAASVGRMELAQWLVQRCGSDLNAQDRESGYTPLHRSIFYGQLNVAVILAQMGADLNIRDCNYLSPIELAMKDRLPQVTFSSNLPCELYVWGTNTNFNLGTGNMQGRLQPEILDFFRKMDRPVSIVQVYMEKFHTVMVSACGRVWTCGHGQGGRLGLGTERSVLAPMQVQLGTIPKKFILDPKFSPGQPEVCVSAAVGRDHTLLLMESHSILVFGLNTHHVLGLSPPPSHLLEPQRLSLKSIEDLKSPPLGVCAGRFHSVVWSRREILTFGLNAGQLGHPKSLEKTIIVPKPIHAMFYKDVDITHVAASDGATVVATGNRHIWVFHEYQRNKLSMRYSLEIEQVAVVGGHLDSGLEPSNLSEKGEPLKIAAISKEGSVFLWQEKDLHMTRCILSPSRQLKIVDLTLSKSVMLLVTNDGEVYTGVVKPCKKKANDIKPLKGRRTVPNYDGEYHVITKQMERGPIKEFLDPDVCYPVSLQRLQCAHRAVKITSDPKGRNFALIQTHPSVHLNNVPDLPLKGERLRQDLSNLLCEANEWDTVHDIIFQVGDRRFPAHKFIVSRQSNILLHMIREAKVPTAGGSVPVIEISDISPDIFEHLLHFIYAGECTLTQPSSPNCSLEKIKNPEKEKHLKSLHPNSKRRLSQQFEDDKGGRKSISESDNESLNILAQAKAAAKRLGLSKLLTHLNCMRYQDGDIIWTGGKEKVHIRNTEIVPMEWKETSEFSDIHIQSKDGHNFYVHKCILVARSEYFHHMLAGGWIESKGTRNLEMPLDQSILSVLFDYIYKDETPILDKIGGVDFELATYSLIAADQLLINPFKTRCEAALASLLTLQNVTMVLELAATYNASDLRNCCYQFICLNLPSLLEAGTLCGLPSFILEGLRDYYCTMHPRMECRVLTPLSYAPSPDFVKELAASNTILWDEELNFDELESQRKSKSFAKKKSRPRRTSESHRSRFRNDSVSSINSDDLDTSLDPEPLDWSDIVEKEESQMSQSFEKISLGDSKEATEKAEKQNQWTKVLSNSKIHKTIQARLKAAATAREEVLVVSPPKQESPVTTLHLHAYPPTPQSPQQAVQQVVTQNRPLKQDAPNITEKHFPQLGYSDGVRGSPKVSLVPMMPISEKRISKLSQKQRKKLALEESGGSSTPIPVAPAPRGWGQRESVPPETPPSLSLADIMQEQLHRSKQTVGAASKPINIRRSPSGPFTQSPHSSGSPWGRMESVMNPCTPPMSPQSPHAEPSPDKSGSRQNFSDIMANEMKQRENWTRMRSKPLNLTQIEDRAIDDLVNFYNANEACEERITVRRVLSTNVACPVWVTSKH